MKELKKKNRNYNKVELLYFAEVSVVTDDPNAVIKVTVEPEKTSTAQAAVKAIKGAWNKIFG